MTLRAVTILLSLSLGGCAAPIVHEIHDLNNEGLALLQQNQHVAAQQKFLRAASLDSSNLISTHNLGCAAHRAGDWETAEKCYRQVLQYQPNHADSRHGLALLMIQQNREQEARQLIDSWLQEQPDRGAAHAEHGWYLRETGDLPAAQATLHHALQLDPGNTRALSELGILYESYAHHDRAFDLYYESLKRDPNQPEIVARLVKLPRAKGRPRGIDQSNQSSRGLN